MANCRVSHSKQKIPNENIVSTDCAVPPKIYASRVRSGSGECAVGHAYDIRTHTHTRQHVEWKTKNEKRLNAKPNKIETFVVFNPHSYRWQGLWLFNTYQRCSDGRWHSTHVRVSSILYVESLSASPPSLYECGANAKTTSYTELDDQQFLFRFSSLFTHPIFLRIVHRVRKIQFY